MRQNFFTNRLMQWNREQNYRSLPWKGEKDPYKIWLSEIILQQTRVEQGEAYYRSFLTAFPNISSLARADETLVFKLWEGLGYYRRCRNLIETARYVDEHLNGNFPADYNAIIALKGVGPYTAAAIASFAFGLPYAVVDGNVKRVLARFFKIEVPVDTGEGKRLIQQLADANLDKKNPAQYNQAIMDLGATVCKPVNPDCMQCPLRARCRAYRDKVTQLIPVKSMKAPVKSRFFNYFLIQYHDLIMVRKRTERDIWNELYDFPLVESVGLLDQKEILQSEMVKCFFDDKVFVVEEIAGPFSQQLTHQKIVAKVISIRAKRKTVPLPGAEWVPKAGLDDLPFPKILHPFSKGRF